MKRLALVFITLLLGSAAAIELPTEGEVTFVSDAGAIVAVGEFADGNLTIEVLAGFSGFVTVVVSEDGSVTTFEATVGADAEISIVDMSSLEFVDLTEAVAEAGGEAHITFAASMEGAAGDVSLAYRGSLDGSRLSGFMESKADGEFSLTPPSERVEEAGERLRSAIDDAESGDAEIDLDMDMDMDLGDGEY